MIPQTMSKKTIDQPGGRRSSALINPTGKRCNSQTQILAPTDPESVGSEIDHLRSQSQVSPQTPVLKWENHEASPAEARGFSARATFNTSHLALFPLFTPVMSNPEI